MTARISLAGVLIALASLCHAAGVRPGYTDNLYSVAPVQPFGYGDMVLDPSGNIYGAIRGPQIRRSAVGSGTWNTIATMNDEAISLVLDGSTLYVGLRNNGQIYTLDVTASPPITPVLFATLSGAINGLVRDCDGAFLAVASNNGAHQLDSMGISTPIFPGLYSGVACTTANRILVSDEPGGRLLQVQLPTSSTVFASGLVAPTAIEVHPGTGNIYVAEEDRTGPSTGTIEELDPTGMRLDDMFATNIGWDWGWIPAPMAFSPDYTELWYLWEDIPGFTLTTEVRFISGFSGLGPTCTLTLQTASPVSDVADFELTPMSSTGAATVDATYDFSTDGGGSWMPASPAPGSSNPAIGVTVGSPALFQWESRLDAVGVMGLAVGVLLRATVDDGTSPSTGSCLTAPFDVDNTALCQGLCGDCDLNGLGPDVLDALTAAQIAAGLLVPSPAQSGCCDVDSSLIVTVLDALGIAQAAAGLMVTLTCP